MSRLSVFQPMVRRHLLQVSFPKGDDYWDSSWQTWVDRIKDGHKNALAQLDARWRTLEEKLGPERMSDSRIAEDFGEDAGRSEEVERLMCGTLVVAIWSQMEHGLTLVCKCVCLQKPELLSQDGKWPRLPRNIGAIAAPLPNTKHGEMALWFQKHSSISLASLSNAPTVDALRVLANCFKHSDGRYIPKDVPVSPSLCSQWGFAAKGAIPYENLDIPVLLEACHDFCADLLGKLPQNTKSLGAGNTTP